MRARFSCPPELRDPRETRVASEYFEFRESTCCLRGIANEGNKRLCFFFFSFFFGEIYVQRRSEERLVGEEIGEYGLRVLSV